MGIYLYFDTVMKFNAGSANGTFLHEMHLLGCFRAPILVYKRNRNNVFVSKVQWLVRHAMLHVRFID